jgi:hypothetical protein
LTALDRQPEAPARNAEPLAQLQIS